MAKADVESAFRLLPVHQDSFRLLGCHWNNEFYVDNCLPMGCSISCAIFEHFSSIVEWVVRDVSGVNSVIQHPDDFSLYRSGGLQDLCGAVSHAGAHRR